jgi:hypothetical protein
MSQRISGVLSPALFFLVAGIFPAQAQFSDGGPRESAQEQLKLDVGTIVGIHGDTADIHDLRVAVATGGKQ